MNYSKDEDRKGQIGTVSQSNEKRAREKKYQRLPSEKVGAKTFEVLGMIFVLLCDEHFPCKE